MKLIVRVWTRGELRCEDEAEVSEGRVDRHPRFADHLALIVSCPEDNMIEIEFPELPESERFFRFGTNPDHMKTPIALDLATMRLFLEEPKQ